MSDTDSFIDEVNEEVRRDQLYGYLKRYGWIAVVLVIGIVGSASYLEWQKSRETAAAQALGDAILGALDNADAAARLAALDKITPSQGSALAIVAMLKANEAAAIGDLDTAIAALESVATDGTLPAEYAQLAALKALMLQHASLSAEDRRLGYQALAAPGSPYRMLAEEQIALIDVELGNIDAAIDRLESIRNDVETSQGLRTRATQLIVALGGTPADINQFAPTSDS